MAILCFSQKQIFGLQLAIAGQLKVAAPQKGTKMTLRQFLELSDNNIEHCPFKKGQVESAPPLPVVIGLNKERQIVCLITMKHLMADMLMISYFFHLDMTASAPNLLTLY